MGKSDKKVKSGRINALRQQYEAFLEEDKKRRERNEYILGRLDKMRSCTAMVQHKPLVCARPQTNVYIRPDQVEIPLRQTQCDRNIQVDTLHCNKESLVLEEIVNKYILIPRSTVVIENIESRNNELKTNVDENVDWKSKYEILNKLKESEKGGLDDNYKERDDQFNSKNKKVNFDQPKNAESLKLSSTYAQPPKKDILSDNKVAYEKHDKNTKNELRLNERTNEKYDDKPTKATREAKAYIDQNSVNDNPETNIKTKYSEIQSRCQDQNNAPKQLNDNYYRTDCGTVNDQSEPENTTESPDKYNEKTNNYVAQKVDYVYEDELKPAQTMNPNEFEYAINNESQIEEDSRVEDSQYPIETIDVSEFTPSDNVQLHDGININPEGYSMNQGNFESAYYHSQSAEVTGSNQHHNTNDELAVNENNIDSVYYHSQSTEVTDSNQHHNTKPDLAVNENEFAHIQNDDSQLATFTTADDSFHATTNYESEPVLLSDDASNLNPRQYEQPKETAADAVDANKPVIDTGDVDELEAEQKEMFFPEMKPKNYDQGGTGDAANVVGDAFNALDDTYTGHFTQNENFEQNEQYYNDLGETTQQYDPSYEQQYSATYEEQQQQLDPQGYGQQLETYEQQQQSYEQQQDYVQQPAGYDQFQQEAYDELQHQHQQENFEDPAHIEQQLDTELGYDENQGQEPQNTNAQENQQVKDATVQQVSSK